jgi:cytochrome c553
VVLVRNPFFYPIENSIMKTGVYTALALIISTLGVGCSNLERSRDVGNPNTPPKALAEQVCSSCHGAGGNSVSPNFPNLAAQTEPYLVEQLKSFRGHSRADPAGFEYMWGLSHRLTDEQIKGLAAYYSSQKLVPVSAEVNEKQVSAGEAIFGKGVAGKNIPACFSCHGDHGQGNAQFPRIAGQHSDYLKKQLLVFQRTDLRPEGAIMKTIAHDLTPQDVENVTAYLQTVAVK